MAAVLMRRGIFRHRHKYTGENVIWRQRQGLECGAHKPRNTWGVRDYQTLGDKHGTDTPPTLEKKQTLSAP